MTLKEVMESHIVTASPDMKLLEVLDMMDIYHLSALAVTDRDKQLLGCINLQQIRLICAHLLTGQVDVECESHLTTSCSDWMTAAPSVNENLTVEAVLQRMVSESLEWVAVTNDLRQLAGIVTCVAAARCVLERKTA